jgi:uncharacterized protein
MRPSSAFPSVKASRILLCVVCIFTLSSCANYYQNHWSFNQEFENGNLAKALQSLESTSRESEGKNRFIYHANQGLLYSILGKYEESNSAFEKAFLFGEDYRINYAYETISYLTNPTITVYRGENHEHLMILYFKALNFLKMNKPEEALIECRRLNIRLNQFSDKYKSEERLQRDAFIHTLMGIIYQSTKDYNNAFIAYRNALDVYENEYNKFFHLPVPEQLKKDLLSTAYWTGFQDEFDKYKVKFGMENYKPTSPEAELVFFWHNGLAPIKDEWGINFAINHRSENVVAFTNESLGINFPFPVKEEKDKKDLSSLEVFRVAFPRYQERPLYYRSARIETDGSVFPLEETEDISQIAFLSLKQRMFEELGKGLLRAALKKAGEHSMRKENERMGAVLGLINAMTEKADTRSWQTLPHSIFYARVPLKEGTNDVKFSIENGEITPYDFKYHARKGQTLFHTFSSLEAKPVAFRYY